MMSSETISGAVYLLSAVTCLACALLLLRGYWRSRTRLLLWSGLCFAGLAAENGILFLDLIVFPEVKLLVFRRLATLVGLSLLLFGLIWDTR
ncbi:MAG TPA: DUF5985 family protein [Gemmataceae bacterium]|jgi:hypothetical protein|nr:DUF5985 family protein [Gemmataceae bacterium]